MQDPSGTKQFARRLQTVEQELQETMLNSYAARQGRSLTLVEFLEKNLMSRVYRPLLEEELNRQANKRQDEETSLQALKDQVAQLELTL